LVPLIERDAMCFHEMLPILIQTEENALTYNGHEQKA
jgi:hypothetical protein